MAFIDVIEAQGDTEQIRNAFYDLGRSDIAAAINALNDPRLRFPTLYALRPEITKLGLEPYLSPRNIAALSISEALASGINEYAYEPAPEHAPVLKWMFMTGCSETGLGGEYDRIIDAAAALLIKAYGDTSCLRALADMIFLRHRKGLYTHDAEWAFFESGEPGCLAMVAGRLLSRDPKDAALARSLLKFLPCYNERTADANIQYRRVVKWLEQNRPYLYYTGESNQMCKEPCRFRVSDECKYLQKSVREAGALSPGEWARFNSLGALDADTKQLLGERSHSLYRNNRQQWRKWLGSPLPVQIASTKRVAGKRGRYGYS